MRMRNWIILIIGIILVCFCAFILFVYSWHGDSRPIEAAANKFVAPKSWKLETNHIIPPSLLCTSGDPCPFVQRNWTAPPTTTFAEVKQFATSSGLHFSVESNPGCKEDDTATLQDHLCWMLAADSTYSYTIAPSGGVGDSPGINFYIKNR